MPSDIATHTLSAADLFEKVKNSVWLVIAANSSSSVRDDTALGSAVAVSRNELVTNCHVIRNRPIIGLVQGTTILRARLSGGQRTQDRCVLITESSLVSVSGVRPFHDLRVGERVYTIGSPRGFQRTLGEGIISGLRSLSDGNFVQTSAPISPGSSGGGLFDERGNLIGVTTLQAKDSQNLNFAISADAFWR
jgi:S1-C subfamily serine protease